MTRTLHAITLSLLLFLTIVTSVTSCDSEEFEEDKQKQELRSSRNLHLASDLEVEMQPISQGRAKHELMAIISDKEYVAPKFRYALNLGQEELDAEIAILKDKISNYDSIVAERTKYLRGGRAFFRWTAYSFEAIETAGTVISAVNWNCDVTFWVNLGVAITKAAKVGCYLASEKFGLDKRKRKEGLEAEKREWKLKLDSFCAARRILGFVERRKFRYDDILNVPPTGWGYGAAVLPLPLIKRVEENPILATTPEELNVVEDALDEKPKFNVKVAQSEARDLDDGALIQRIAMLNTLLDEFDEIAQEKYGRKESTYYLTWAYRHKRIEKTLRAVGHVGEAIEAVLTIVNTADIGCENKGKVSIGIAVIKGLKVALYYIAGQSEDAAKRRKKRAHEIRDELSQWRHFLQEEARARGIKPTPNYINERLVAIREDENSGEVIFDMRPRRTQSLTEADFVSINMGGLNSGDNSKGKQEEK